MLTLVTKPQVLEVVEIYCPDTFKSILIFLYIS